MRGRQGVITDGPFAETKEQLGGLIAFEAEDDTAALAWLDRLPRLFDSTIELRPVLEDRT